MSIQKISTEQLRRMGDREGLVLQGCGIVIFEPHSGDGLTVQNGGVCLLVDFVLLPVTNKEVSGDHQDKSRIRVSWRRSCWGWH